MAHKRGNIWWISYTDASGCKIRRSAQTRSKREAEKLEQRLKVEAQEIKNGQSNNTTVDQLLIFYLENTQDKPSHKSDKSRAKNLLVYFADQKITEIKRHDILNYIDGRKKAGYAASSINQEVGLLSAAITYTNLRYDWQIPNPCHKVKQKEPDGRDVWITKTEAAQLITAARLIPKQNYLAPLIILALNTGMRRLEMLSLQWTDVDFPRCLIRLRSENAKTRKARAIPLNADAISALRELQNNQISAGLNLHHVFQSPNSKTEHITEIKKSFSSARKAVGLDKVHFHDLRHTYVTWSIMDGVPIHTISKIMGHSTTYMTE